MKCPAQTRATGVCPMFTFDSICDRPCLRKRHLRIETMIEAVRSYREQDLTIPFDNVQYHVTYAPVGNYPTEPLVIISGKTTSGDSSDLFKRNLVDTGDLYFSCVTSIFSNMKNRLFVYLNKIGLFDYLRKRLAYWDNDDYRSKWDRIFTDPKTSSESGIQMTQAFNCAILNRDRRTRSSQPPKKVFNAIQREFGCLFKHFRITDSLRLIIFLDTPGSPGSFHQIDYWKKVMEDNDNLYNVISITHPSAQNSIIYDNLDNLEQIETRKKEKAIRLLDVARRTVQSLP